MKRPVVLAAFALAAVVLLVGVVIALRSPYLGANEQPSDQPTPHPTSPAPVPASSATPGGPDSDGSELAKPFVAAESAALGDQSRSIRFSDIATDDALEDLAIGTQEMTENGLVQVGSPELVSAVVTKLNISGKPPTAVVRICQDFSGVDIQALDGRSIKDERAVQRVPSILVLHQVHGVWLAAKRTFPAKDAC